MEFARLFEPLVVGTMTMKNRVVFPPMVANLGGPNGESTDRAIAYYEARAQGGAGTVIVEASGVRADGKANTNSIGIHDDALIPGLRALASAIRRHGAVSVIQINHVGRQARSRVTGAQPICPSPIPCPIRKEMPRELPVQEIKELIELFVLGAERAKEAGFDAVEVHGAHGYLVAQFMSPHVNHRNDEYGGDPERRLRLPLEIIAGIRRRCGDHYPIFFRFSADEGLPDGLTLDDTRVIARQLVDAGVTVLDVSAGTYETGIMISPRPCDPRGILVPYADAIKRAVNVPVITVGKITDPGFAEQVLRDGKADLVAVGRGMLAEADFAAKAQGGRQAQIQKCICCRNCSRATQRSMALMCAVNPKLGREREFASPTTPKNVLVTGSGLSAMQASLAAALRGHQVNLSTGGRPLGGPLATTGGPTNFEAAMVVKMLITRIARERVAVSVEPQVSPPPDYVIAEAGSEGQLGTFDSLPHQSVDYCMDARSLHAALIDGARAALAI